MEVAVGPLLFHWPVQRVRDFYARLADEAPVERVYLGEVVCGKREPRTSEVLLAAAERLTRAGKQTVWSTLALPAAPREVRAVSRKLASAALVEINDISALFDLDPGAPFVAGPFLNVYNEAAAAELIDRGCMRLCGNVELPLASLAAIARACPALELEIFAYGRLPLALSARCYHARAHGLHKDGCQFVCERDPDGMEVRTVEQTPFLAVNGVQTLSHGVQVADAPLAELQAAGVRALRLSPHSGDFAAVCAAFRRFADGAVEPDELKSGVLAAGPPGPLVSGYLRGLPGIAAADGD